jgi:hypothetical protein
MSISSASTNSAPVINNVAASQSTSSSVFDLLNSSLPTQNSPTMMISPQVLPSSTLAPAPAPINLISLDLLTPEPFRPASNQSVQQAAPAAPAVQQVKKASITDAFADMSLLSPSLSSPVVLSDIGSPLSGVVGSAALNAFSLEEAEKDYHPMRITTAEFGSRWGQLAHEQKRSISCKIKTLDQLRTSMPTSIGHVESIIATNEAIFACSTTSGGVALLHIQLVAARMTANITVKSSASDICNSRLQSICQYLSSI